MELLVTVLVIIFLGKLIIKRLDGVVLALLETESLKKLIEILDDEPKTKK